jgi:MFS family permease
LHRTIFSRMNNSDKTKWFGSDRTLVALCIAAFMMSAAGGMYLVALPFMIKRLGGTDGDAGVGMALNFGAYLLACLAAARLIDRFNAKRLVQCGAIGISTAFAGAACTVLWGRGAGAIWTLNLFSMVAGVFTAIVWPPMMGWLSTGYEGTALSHRFGSYNMSWSSGSWISPYLGGLLVGVSSMWSMAAAAVAAGICFAAVAFARNPRRDEAIAVSGPMGATVHKFHPDLARFRQMARVALVTAFVCVGLLRSQLGLLIKFELNYSEATYGIAITIFCAANFAVFMAAGRAHKWHYVGWLFWGAQLVTAGAMLLIVYYPKLWMLFVAAGIVGICEGFIYVSHLFYGVSGGKRRSGLMALHELLLSGGIVIGSVAGGYISDASNRYMPYWFGAAAILLGLAIQAAIWMKLRSQ